jgi:hypothetical protein
MNMVVHAAFAGLWWIVAMLFFSDRVVGDQPAVV